MRAQTEETVDAVPGPEIVERAPRTRTRRVTEAKWTIQQRQEWDVEDETAEGGTRTVVVWEDLVTIEVPAGTKRKTVLERGLGEAKIAAPADGLTLKFRALDEDSAREIPVESDRQLRIGGAS